jgi:hypothetical protein
MIGTAMRRINTSGKAEVSFEDGTLWIKVPGSGYRQGTSVFGEDRKTLLPVLESHRFDEVKGVFL